MRVDLKSFFSPPKSPLPWSRAFRGALSVGACAAVGVFMNEPGLGVIAAICALWAWTNDLGGTYLRRLTSMATAGAMMLLGGAIGGLIADLPQWHFWVVLVAMLLIGIVHNSSRALENAARFGGFALVIAATLGISHLSEAWPVIEGVVWTIVLMTIEHLIKREEPSEPGTSVRAGLIRMRTGEVIDWHFGVRYAVAVAIGLAIAEHFGARRAAWVALTTIAVMRPNDAESAALVGLRAAGTLIGVGIAAIIVSITHEPSALVGAAAILAFAISPCMTWQRWAGFTAIIAMAMVLLDLSWLTQGGDRPLLLERIYDTGLGCAIALAATVAIPARFRASGGNPPPTR